MNEFETFESGVSDAESDLRENAVCVGPTDSGAVSLDYIVNEFRARLNCSDSYLAGYLSVVFR